MVLGASSFSSSGHSLFDVLGGVVGEAVAELDNVGHVAHVQASRGHRGATKNLAAPERKWSRAADLSLGFL